MSRSDKDKAGGHPRRDKPRSGRLGCLCCEVLVPDSRSPQRRVRENAAWSFELTAEQGPDPSPSDGGHQFLDSRCLRCQVHHLDALLPQYQQCPERSGDEPIVYMTTTEGEVHISHPVI